MREVDSGPLEAQCVLVNAKLSLQPALEVFRGQSPPCLFLPPISPHLWELWLVTVDLLGT